MVCVLPEADTPYAMSTLLVCARRSWRTIGPAVAWKKASCPVSSPNTRLKLYVWPLSPFLYLGAACRGDRASPPCACSRPAVHALALVEE